MVIPVIRIQQGPNTLYMTTLTAEFLTNPKRVSVDKWNPKNREGYQREPVAARAREYAKYIGGASGMTPNSVLLNIRKKIDGFKPSSKEGVTGSLSVPDAEKLWIVDGQHRIEGLRMLLERSPEFGTYPVPVVLTVGGNQYDEARQFVIVNKTQKGVVPDLAERLIADKVREKESSEDKIALPRAIGRDIAWLGVAMRVTDTLNESDDATAGSPFHRNPWCGRIQLPNTRRGVTLVRQKAFTDSLKHLVLESLLGYSPDEIAMVLSLYWKAILSHWAGAAKSPRDYMVQKTMGVTVFHLLLPRVLRLTSEHHGRLSLDGFKRVLGEMRQHFRADGAQSPDEYWRSDGTAGIAGTSRKAVGIIFDTHKRALDDAYAGKKARQSTRPFEL